MALSSTTPRLDVELTSSLPRKPHFHDGFPIVLSPASHSDIKAKLDNKKFSPQQSMVH